MNGRMVFYMHRLSAVILLFFIVSPSAANAGERDDTSGEAFNWKGAMTQSLYFLGIEHTFRLTEERTRTELKGPFFPDWKASVEGVQSWSDGGSFFANYIAHPMQGGVSGFIQIQNDGRGNRWSFRVREHTGIAECERLGGPQFTARSLNWDRLAKQRLETLGRRKGLQAMWIWSSRQPAGWG